ncbi:MULTISPECIES: IS110 family transposase [Streptosporangium]|uniref:Transposase n=1 Tax=Streptosporangium brasiliense TaxID=47480 RepID=A0ABT9R3V1_9ACTN|nr:transposase [Streptosporangium brasiliense]MDP9863897.1 transposase [Streptosporangium brasiliense]
MTNMPHPAQPGHAMAAGYRSLLGWARGFGMVVRAGVECTGSYGAALTRHLRQAGIQVVEVNQPDKAARRRRGRTDAVDAEAAARAVLSEPATAVPKSGDGHVEAMRVFKLARDSAVKIVSYMVSLRCRLWQVMAAARVRKAK